MSTTENPAKLLPHHEQKELCTTRPPYRQGRKLTAVKVYTIFNESKHLLIFGVPSLNLRQETKSLFMKFGKILQFNKTDLPSEQFTETYHAAYESIQSARVAKKMLDTKNFYGGSLHVCYAPELETVEDVKEKLLLRKQQVLGRLKNLKREAERSKQKIDNKIEERLNVNVEENSNKCNESVEKMNMGVVNTIAFGKRKFKEMNKKISKKSKLSQQNTETKIEVSKYPESDGANFNSSILNTAIPSVTDYTAMPSTTDTQTSTDIIDFTSPQTEVLSNINEALNYNKFGTEVIKKVPSKTVNRIKFNISNKKLL